MTTTDILKDYMTMTQAAKKLGVSRQRMHMLRKLYDLEVIQISTGLMLISKDELAKLPKKRPTGKHRIVR